MVLSTCDVYNKSLDLPLLQNLVIYSYKHLMPKTFCELGGMNKPTPILQSG